METLQITFEALKKIAPFIIVILGVLFLLKTAYWSLIQKHGDLRNERKFTRQIIILALMLLGLLALIFSLPISDDSRNKLIGLLGIVISGALAFSSTTILANLAAGFVIQITKPFKTGDFIRIDQYFGRVTERGLFDIEIQAETRELISLPNTFCISHPVSTIRTSGTIISVSLSLGYEVCRSRVESLLLEAAEKENLEQPFVHILELGNFAITYRISGFLADPKILISKKSKLYGSVLDVLLKNGVEIMSPSYMNQKPLKPDYQAIPPSFNKAPSKESEVIVENIAFDKAEQAEKVETKRTKVLEDIDKLKDNKKQTVDNEEKELIKKKLDLKQKHLEKIDQIAEDIKSADEKIGS